MKMSDEFSDLDESDVEKVDCLFCGKWFKVALDDNGNPLNDYCSGDCELGDEEYAGWDTFEKFDKFEEEEW